MNKWIIAPVLAGVVAVGGVAYASSPATINTQPSQVVDVKQAPQTDTKQLSADEATAIALEKAKGTVTKVELDTDDGWKHYDIEIKDGVYEYDFEIDAVTGKIIEFEKDRDDDQKRTVSKQANVKQTSENKQGMISQDEAVAIAMKQASGTVTDVELDHDDGRKVYEIEIHDGTFEYDFDIDAFTGKVLKFKKDRDDD
ncbi:PepSY domain-containing protein [Sporosarcina sp. HYO08]|uniref:PepSY domain-containing protein n=1 Tax=Sporosarcina sp. HYO08 TaxID=1759557 RepID=UPI00079C8820|nr:PepSY domain-containing protein [Sporosarcina sp. HYO08]KXH83827.1 hypothetical protein AU377_03430 [Sporosarcina sp. HYO08]